MKMEETIARHEQEENIAALEDIRDNAEAGFDGVTQNLAEEAIARVKAIQEKAEAVQVTTPTELSKVESMGGSMNEVKERTEPFDAAIAEVKQNATAEIETITKESKPVTVTPEHNKPLGKNFDNMMLSNAVTKLLEGEVTREDWQNFKEQVINPNIQDLELRKTEVRNIEHTLRTNRGLNEVDKRAFVQRKNSQERDISELEAVLARLVTERPEIQALAAKFDPEETVSEKDPQEKIEKLKANLEEAIKFQKAREKERRWQNLYWAIKEGTKVVDGENPGSSEHVELGKWMTPGGPAETYLAELKAIEDSEELAPWKEYFKNINYEPMEIPNGAYESPLPEARAIMKDWLNWANPIALPLQKSFVAFLKKTGLNEKYQEYGQTLYGGDELFDRVPADLEEELSQLQTKQVKGVGAS